MSTNVITVVGSPGVNSLDLGVTASGMKIVVHPGEFVVGRKAGVIVEEQEFEVTKRNEDVCVYGYIVENRKTGELSLLVDEVVKDGRDEPVCFGDTPFSLVFNLFYVLVPGRAESLNDFVLTITRMVIPGKDKL